MRLRAEAIPYLDAYLASVWQGTKMVWQEEEAYALKSEALKAAREAVNVMLLSKETV